MRSSRAFVINANNSFDKGAGDYDKLYFGVGRTPEDDDIIVERRLVVDLGKTVEVATQEREFVSRGRYNVIDPLTQMSEFGIG